MNSSAATLEPAVSVDVYVKRLVDAAPPLNEKQRRRLAVLFRPRPIIRDKAA